MKSEAELKELAMSLLGGNPPYGPGLFRDMDMVRAAASDPDDNGFVCDLYGQDWSKIAILMLAVLDD